AVIALQERLPRARVLYCSATGVSEVGNMAYMVRMGLWGTGTPFNDFATFLDAFVRNGYLGFGACRARGGKSLLRLNTAERPIANKYREGKMKRTLKRELKVPTVVSEAREALAAGQCVVIGLQSTGESAADAVGLEPGPVPGFVSPTKEMLLRFVAQHFPVRRAAAAAGGEEEIQVCVSMREELLTAIDQLALPANFLDEIIDQLGGPGQVAEMTGRKGRVVRVAAGSGPGAGQGPPSRARLVYEQRAKPDTCEMDSLNISEKDLFLRGTKLVAIISDAASTGISLHASRAAANQRRRRHLTIELPWSADKAIQQLGRSHRSNQVSAPLYKLISTRIGGEKRFAAAVARRLQSLGALTRGDRRAASGVNLSDYNFDSAIGRKSLKRMYDHIMLPTAVLPHGVTLADVDTSPTQPHTPRPCDGRGGGGTSRASGAGGGGGGGGDVRRFLNRLLGLRVEAQGLLFAYFVAVLGAEIHKARSEGRYSEGLADVAGTRIRLQVGSRSALWVDPLSKLVTTSTAFSVDRGLSWEVRRGGGWGRGGKGGGVGPVRVGFAHRGP
ncbi:hypothetical protein VOLCADRAFT_58526, partial [Volvox carteri f. nagariensis]